VKSRRGGRVGSLCHSEGKERQCRRKIGGEGGIRHRRDEEGRETNKRGGLRRARHAHQKKGGRSFGISEGRGRGGGGRLLQILARKADVRWLDTRGALSFDALEKKRKGLKPVAREGGKKEKKKKQQLQLLPGGRRGYQSKGMLTVKQISETSSVGGGKKKNIENALFHFGEKGGKDLLDSFYAQQGEKNGIISR